MLREKLRVTQCNPVVKISIEESINPKAGEGALFDWPGFNTGEILRPEKAGLRMTGKLPGPVEEPSLNRALSSRGP